MTSVEMAKHLTNEQRELVDVVKGMYSMKPESDPLVSKHYTSDCRFIDPLVEVAGQAHVKAQFRSLRMLFQDIDFQVHGAGLVGEALVIQATVRYVPRLLPRMCTVQLEQFTHLTVSSGQVQVHEDHWSIHGCLKAVLGLGWIYGHWRQLLGWASSAVVNACPKRKAS